MTGPTPARDVQVLVACCVAFFSVLSYRSVIYSAMPAVSAEIGLRTTTVGLIMAAIYTGHVVGVLSSPFLAVRRRHVVVGGLLVAAAAVVGFSMARSALGLAATGMAGGWGLGLYLTRGTAMIIETFAPGTRARAMGWHEVASSAGLMGGGLFVGLLLLVVSWRVTVVLWAGVALGAVVLVRRWMPDGSPARTVTARAPLDLRIGALALLGGAGLAVHGGFYSILPTLLVDAGGLTPPAAATYAGWARTSGFVGALAGGWTSDRIGSRRSLAGWYTVALVGAGILPAAGFGWVFTAALVTMTVGACAAVTASYALLGDAYGPGEVERAFGLIAALVSVLGSVVTPIALGAALEHFGAVGAGLTIAMAPVLGLVGVGLYRVHQGRVLDTPPRAI